MCSTSFALRFLSQKKRKRGQRGLLIDCFLACQQSILHQRDNGHRAYTSRNRGDVGAFRSYLIELHVTCQFKARFLAGIRYAGSTYVDYHSTLFHHFRFHEVGLSQCGDDDIRFPALFHQIFRTAVAYGYRCVSRIAFCIISAAIGLPTMLLRPSTTHFLPEVSI